jgi:predicted alpha/beta-hydrolase family hydrolase
MFGRFMETVMPGHVILSHGSDSGPDATKVSALAKVAESMGWTHATAGLPPTTRLAMPAAWRRAIARLRAASRRCKRRPVLVGSSMGSFVSGLASLDVPVAGSVAVGHAER